MESETDCFFFERWLIEIIDALKRAEDAGERPAPFAVNLVVLLRRQDPNDLQTVDVSSGDPVVQTR